MPHVNSKTRLIRDEEGFTLLELLISLGIIALAVSISFPLLTRGNKQNDIQFVAKQIAAQLRTARGISVSRNISTPVRIDIERRRYIGVDGKPRQIPRNISATLKAARIGKHSKSTGTIRFFPDGSSTGGSLQMKEDGKRLTLKVDWMTGFVSIVKE